MQRFDAVQALKRNIDQQMKLVERMAQGDGRTSEFRKVSEDSDALEAIIQKNIEIINSTAESLK